MDRDDFSPDGFTVDEAAEVAGELSRLAVGRAEVGCTGCDACYDFIGVEILRCALD